jgi:cell division protein ZapA (FtsZ GTPase activity inhibitor)
MLEKKIKIDQKEYIIRSQDWQEDILLEAAAQLEKGILYYKKNKDELSAVVLAALAFAYDSVAKSKELPQISNEKSNEDYEKCEEELRKVLQKINKHLQTPQNVS